VSTPDRMLFIIGSCLPARFYVLREKRLVRAVPKTY
jgi:hypothetical protein